jgi:AraC-like DNA-binding protein/quercetin dioxygenase-like cupin family protein
MALSGHHHFQEDTAMSVIEHSAVGAARLGPADADEETSAMFTVSRDVLRAGSRFERHSHQEDQVAWLVAGSVELEVQGERWHLRRDHLMWVPAGTMHEMVFPERAEIVSLYVDPVLRPDGEWATPRTLEADPLVGALMLHLTEGVPTPRRRAQCRRLLADVLGDLAIVRDVVALPRNPRARTVAARLLDDPADGRELDAWAAELGVSGKTLARAFVHGTGSTFRDWRIHARLHAATRHLADGATVQDTASVVGYTSVSSFIAAFKQRFGVTPARYAADLRRTRGESGR